MISVFNTLPFYLGNFSSTVSPFVSVAATASAETINEIIWLKQVDSY